MRGLYFIECALGEDKKRWRIARCSEVAAVEGSYFVATFLDPEDEIDVSELEGSRMVGPFSVQQLLICVEISDYVSTVENGFLPQKKPDELPITATKANGLAHAATRYFASDPNWKWINFEEKKP